MPRLGRLGAAILLSLVASFAGLATPAVADHCPPIDNPEPVPGQNTTYCHTPKPTQAPPTPKPTAKPTTPPATAAPRTAGPGPITGPTRTSTAVSTPEPTPFDIEVPDEPLATTEIIVDPIDDTTEFEAGEQAGSASNWIFGFIVGFFLGGVVGRMSWGIRRRRRQQIFG